MIILTLLVPKSLLITTRLPPPGRNVLVVVRLPWRQREVQQVVERLVGSHLARALLPCRLGSTRSSCPSCHDVDARKVL